MKKLALLLLIIIVFISGCTSEPVKEVGEWDENSTFPESPTQDKPPQRPVFQPSPLQSYLDSRECGNNICEIGEDSKTCSSDCAPAKLSSDKWTQVSGPYGGYITDLKKVGSDLIATAGFIAGGTSDSFFRIINKGTEWKPLAGTGKSSGKLAVHPGKPERILFISEGNLYISKDSGLTSEMANIGGETRTSVAISPANPDLLFVGIGSGSDGFIYISIDGGKTFKKQSQLPMTEWSVEPIWTGFENDQSKAEVIAPHPVDENIIFVGTNSALLKSTDKGKTWEKIDSSFHRTDVKDIAINPANPDEIYVRIGVFEDFICMNTEEKGKEFEKQNCAGIYKSTDTGDTWEQLEISFADPSEGGIFVDEHDPDTAYAVFSRKIFRTTDGGKTWEDFFYTHDQPFVPNVGIEKLVVGENSDELYIGGHQGLWHTGDGGKNWKERNKGFIGSEVVDIVKAPDGTLYAGTYTLGMFKSTDNGQSWTFASYNLENPYVMVIATHPTDPDTIFVTTNGGIYASSDGALTWERIGKSFFGESEFWKDISHFHGIAFDPQDPKRIYIGGGGDQYTPKGAGIIISRDGGKTWKESNSGFATDVHVSKIVVSKKNPAVVYATTQGATEFQEKTGLGQGIFRSSDYGDTWQQVNGNLPTSEINTLAIDPNNGDVLYVGTDDSGLFKSIDGGSMWKALVIPGLPESYGVGDIIVDPNDSNRVFVGIVDYFRLSFSRGLLGDYGVYVSNDAGKTWKDFNQGLNHKGSYALELDENSILYVGTRRGGVYWREVK